MKNLFRFLLFLVFLGSFGQGIVLYFYDYVQMVNNGVGNEQLTGLIVLLVIVCFAIWLFKKVMNIVSYLIFRKD